LLPLRAVEDNAAMQTESPKALPPKRKRRRFQFSLRSLFMVTTIAAMFAGTWRLFGPPVSVVESIDDGTTTTFNVAWDVVVGIATLWIAMRISNKPVAIALSVMLSLILFSLGEMAFVASKS
jgi:hypothetical protein